MNVGYETAAPGPIGRVVGVAEGFGLDLDSQEKFVIYEDTELRIGAGDVVYITGDSGSGKSVLLRALKQDLADEAADIADVKVDFDKPLIETVGKDLTLAPAMIRLVALAREQYLNSGILDNLADTAPKILKSWQG